MHTDHRHGHSHGHFHADNSAQLARLRLALLLTATFLVAEVVGGVLANSLALLADAGHMLTDVGALALSLFVVWFSRQPATPEKTYGYLRWEILAALINGSVLLVAAAAIVWEAIERLREPQPVAGGLMLLVAIGGLVVNAVAAWVLHPVHRHSLNARGAYLHVIGDLLGSVGTVVAALVIRWTGWNAADPLASLFVTLLVIRSGWRLVRESVDILLEATPAHISLGAVRRELESIAGVESVHDLHVWSVTSGVVAMSAHAVVRPESDTQRVLEDAVAAMGRLGIGHVTVQLETREMCRDTHP
ncbi:MAG TPA: cation diffusion facilitator family transporter [Gemmatimonadaceae bacterium]|nr:cation diffusion facilitator family transporter [Gemmatimonadaceae bacterium]